MHIEFDPRAIDWSCLLGGSGGGNPEPAVMYGGGAFVAFRGMPYQRGAGVGSIFRSLLRYLMPLGKEVARTVGRQGLESGVQILSDVMDGRRLGDAAADHGRMGARKLLEKASNRLQQGNGRRRLRTATSINSHRPTIGTFTTPSTDAGNILLPATTTKQVATRKTAPKRRRRSAINRKKKTGRAAPLKRKRKPVRKKSVAKRRRRDALGFY